MTCVNFPEIANCFRDLQNSEFVWKRPLGFQILIF
jgi:hypothetical protein